MNWWAFLVLALIQITIVVWTVVIYQGTPLAHHHTTWNRLCDVEKYCPLYKRGLYDTSWVCCEGSGGYPVSHILAPMTVMLLSDDFWFSLALDMAWEVLEVTSWSLARGQFFQTAIDRTDFETPAGSLIGDVVSCGVLGIMIAILMNKITGWHGLRRDTISSGVRWKYFAIVVVAIAIWLLPTYATPTFNYGLLIAVVVSFFLVLFLLPFAMRNSDAAVKTNPPCLLCPHDEALRVRWWWAAALAVIGVTGFGYIYFFNPFYQIWINAYAFLLVELIVLAVRQWRSRKQPLLSAVEECDPKIN
jgi:small-conductance mechanosensitive channel